MKEMFQLAKTKLVEENFPSSNRELEGKAKEDARYILPLSTQTQMGVTINARSLERLLRRLDGCGLTEAKELKNIIFEQVKDIAPSVIKYTKAEVYEKVKNNIPRLSVVDNKFHWQLNHHSENPDVKILAYYIFENCGESLDNIEKYPLFFIIY